MMDSGWPVALTAVGSSLGAGTLGGTKAARVTAAADGAALDKAAHDFTAMFMAQMLQPMMESVRTNDTFGGGHGEDSMRLFLIQEYGKAVAQGPDGGLTSAIRRELAKAQNASLSSSAANVRVASR